MDQKNNAKMHSKRSMGWDTAFTERRHHDVETAIIQNSCQNLQTGALLSGRIYSAERDKPLGQANRADMSMGFLRLFSVALRTDQIARNSFMKSDGVAKLFATRDWVKFEHMKIGSVQYRA
ncbi:MAG: hypothetical protein U5K36_13280 [Roseovarius sp.]|nr:hypothetical protein [Roseovarius sp.]